MAFKFILQQNSPDGRAPLVRLAEYSFEGNLITVGSDAANTIVLPNALPEQAIIIREGEQITLINSGEGTRFNNANLRREAMEPLAHGDEIKIADFIIFVADDAENAGIPQRSKFAENPMANDSDKEINDGQIAEKALAENFVPANERLSNGATKNGEPTADFESSAKKPARNFADVLNALRTEEDSFYFIVENVANTENARVPIEQAEMPVGLSASGKITCAAEQINLLCAVVRKDWSGIVVEAQRGGAIAVNDETIKTTARLRNGDRLTFSGAKKLNKKTPYLELHEPSSLVALDSILETRSRNGNLYGNNSAVNNAAPLVENKIAAPVSIYEKNYFGYFSFFEVVAMAIGTLIAGVLIFLLLEYSI